MIIMNIEMDNFMSFNNFAMNLSYPKKIVNSSIENEFLTGFYKFQIQKSEYLDGCKCNRKNFIWQNANDIFHFKDKKQYADWSDLFPIKRKRQPFALILWQI